MKRWPSIASFVLFIALCVSAAYWAMQLFKPPLRPVAASPQTARPAPGPDAAANLFGGRPSIAVSGNIQLKGVVAAGNPAESVAILAVNGKPARAVSANKEVAPGITLKEVSSSHVLLLENGSIRRVDLPEDVQRR